jgi:hypothetical protein
MLSYRYSKAAVTAYMKRLFAENDVLHSKDMNVIDDHAYVMSLLSMLSSSDPEVFFDADILDGVFTQAHYRIPQIRFVRKE